MSKLLKVFFIFQNTTNDQFLSYDLFAQIMHAHKKLLGSRKLKLIVYTLPSAP